MNLQEKLMALQKSVNTLEISFNENNEDYKSVKEYLDDTYYGDTIKKYTDADIVEQIIEKDTLISIDCYPLTQVSSFNIYHYDLEMGLDELIEGIKKQYSEVYHKYAVFERKDKIYKIQNEK